MNRNLCGIIQPNGKDCPIPVADASPLNLCAKHIRQAAELYASATNHIPETRVRERCPDCDTMALVAHCSPNPIVRCTMCNYTRTVTPAAIPTEQQALAHLPASVVYYLRFSDRIKIGTTRNLKARLVGIPHDEVLATEPGDRTLEQERHRQFAHLRLTRRGEWFRAGPDLIDHTKALRATV